MSNYKTGDKFIIELGEQVGDLWKIKGFKALTFDANGLNKLGRLVQGVDVFSHNKGAKAAWELAKKVSLSTGFSYDEIREIFGVDDPCHVYDLTYAAAAAKVEEWKEKNKINVGEVVEVIGNGPALVVDVDECGVHVMFSSGEILPYTYASVKKTDRGIWNLIGYNKAE